MGFRSRNKQRKANLRKMPNESSREFVKRTNPRTKKKGKKQS